MRRLAYLLSLICLVTLMGSPASAHATTLNLSPYVGQTVSMTVEPYAFGENNGSFYVGLTDVNIAKNGIPLGSLEAFCDDFNHEISLPDTYSAVVTAVAGNTTLEQEAYYGLLLGSSPSGNSTMDSDIQELIWNFSAPGHFALNSEMSTLQAQMLANYQNVDYSDSFYLNAGNGGQSFMTTAVAFQFAEPSSLLLLGTGLLLTAWYARQQLRSPLMEKSNTIQ